MRIRPALALLVVLAPAAGMAGPVLCTAGVDNAPVLDPTTTSAAVGNFTLNCTGGGPGSFLTNFDFNLNTPVISPGSWILMNGSNSFPGTLGATNSVVEFQNVAFNLPGAGPTWIVKNILVNPSLSPGGFQFDEAVSVSGPIPIANPFQLVATNGPETLINFQGGSTSTPVLLPSGHLVGKVTGAIGGFLSQDYYSFSWSGGAFSATASVSVPGAPGAGVSYLFSESLGGTCNSGAIVTLDSSDSFTNTIGIANLAAGQYCIGISATGVNDPPFALTFNTPVTGPVPEPSGFVLLSIGFGMIGALRLRRRRKEYS